MYKRYVALTIVDEKAAIDVGEPDFPITAAKQNRKGLEVLDNPNYAGDHDFHRFKITAYVFDVVNIPDNPSESFYTVLYLTLSRSKRGMTTAILMLLPAILMLPSTVEQILLRLLNF